MEDTTVEKKATTFTGNVATKKQEVKSSLIEQKYSLRVNPRESGYHSLPKALRDNTAKIGSCWQSANGTLIGNPVRGLTSEQERYFAASLIAKTPRDEDFDLAMRDFWSDLSITIIERLDLDASYEVKTVKLDGEMVEMEIPVNLQDYYKANFCKASSKVAFTSEEKANSDLYDVIMDDLSVKKKEEREAFALKTDALLLFSELAQGIKENKPNEKVDFLVELLKEPNENFYGKDTQDKLAKIMQVMTTNPTLFKETYNDPNLSERAFAHAMVAKGIITIEGDTYFDGEINMGRERELYAYLQDPTKSSHVVKLKARLEESYKRRIK